MGGRILSAAALATAALAVAWPGRAQEAAPRSYAEIRPLLHKYCGKCHGATRPKAQLDLTTFPDEASVLKNRKVWKRILDQVQGQEMPPDDKPQPSPAEREALVAWIESAIERVEPGQLPDPGRVVIRRLNRVEYRNTVRDLLAVDLDPTADFPSDDVGYGFDNIGDVLSLPPLLMEKYVAAAEAILDRAIQAPEDFKPQARRLEAETMNVTTGGQSDGDFLVLYAAGEMYQAVGVARAGDYRLRIRAAGDQAGPEPARMALRIDGREIKVFDVTAARRDPKLYEHTVRLDAGTRRLGLAFVNDYYNPEAPRARDRDRNLYVDSVELTGPVDAHPPEPPPSHRRIFRSAPSKAKPARQAAAEILSALASRAFRRPLRDGELERLLSLFDLGEKHAESFESALKAPLLAVLVSPHFLYRVERDRPDAPAGVHRIDGFELASRLSYFVWSSLPDDALFEAARKGRLHEPAVLEAELRRMLRDPKARALAENFATQWLQIRRLEAHAPDPKRFPAWDEALRKAMLEEAVLLFHEVVKDDRSVVDLLAADFTYLNERLARHYGIPGIQGPALRRVDLEDPRRGGVLMLGAVLTVTSNPTRTAAVKRGKWMMEVILGTPPPPPVPDAGELRDETEEDRKRSLRERLEKHRADPNCASCHRRMDPLGFGFENYDAVGAWRERDGRLPVDAAATLPDGRSFDGPVALKKLLLERREDFVRNLVEKMLTYALGRGVEYYDGPEVRRIRKALADKEYRMSALVLEVARSYPFQHRRNRASEVDDE